MAESAGDAQTDFEHEVFISHSSQDRAWAERLREDLSLRGIGGVVADFTLLRTGEAWADALEGALLRSRTLLVLWTPAAAGATGIQREISTFAPIASLARLRGDHPRPIIPIFFGKDLIEDAPDELRSRQGIMAGPELYASEPDAISADWERLVDAVVRAVTPESGAAASEPLLSPAEESAPPALDPQFGLDQMRAWVIHDGQTRPGWILGDRLAIARVKGPLRWEHLTVRTTAGSAAATVAPWPQEQPKPVEPFTVLHLVFPLALRHPLPIGQPRVDQAIEAWGWSLKKSDARGRIGPPQPDGSFDLTIPRGGAIENGAAIWDDEERSFVGIASHVGRQRWRLIPVAMIETLVSTTAPRSNSIAPPSARIHDDSWTIDDRLGYTLYARAIAEFIQHPDTKPPLVIGIQGPWGQGKTSLMRLAQDRLDPQHADLAPHKKAIAPPDVDGPSAMTFKDLRDSLDGDIAIDQMPASEIRSVWFNPWKYQSSEALWAGLAHSILTQLPTRLPRAQRELFWLKLQVRRIDATAIRRDIHRLALQRLLPLLVASVLIAAVIGAALAVDMNAATGVVGGMSIGAMLAVASWVAAWRTTLGRKLEGSYRRYVSEPDYAGKLGYLHQVEEDMRHALSLLTPADQPTVIFIDDLDRCSAAKISEVLEAINLFLSGEYPNCIFVLGIDARVVASAMETIHRQALGEDESGDEKTRGNLGWRFLDKFIQLSFVMPRPDEQQRENYLASLLGTDLADRHDDAEDGDAGHARLNAERIRQELAAGALKIEEATRQVGELSSDPDAQPEEVRQVAEEVIALGAERFSDADRETVEALRNHLPHLSDNPRTIKRAVNLYRFYRFISWAREASSPDLLAPAPELVASWTVIAARWPQAVHWLQVNGRGSDNPEGLLLETWADDEPELCAFLANETTLDLGQAMKCGLW